MKTMAVVALASFGVRVLADPVSIGGDDFEGYTEGDRFAEKASNDWTVDSDDESVISTAFVTEFPECATFGEGDTTKVLELNTNGKDASFAVNSGVGSTVLVDALVKMVGSDTPPAFDDTSVQTAVYLNTEDGYLHAWSSVWDDDAEKYVNTWTTLEGVKVEDGEWVCLKIEVEYTTGLSDNSQKAYATVTVNGSEAGAPFVVANKVNAWTKQKVTSVSFRGTGMVDNFAVSEEARVISYTSFETEFVNIDNNETIGSLPTVQRANGTSYVYEFGPITGKPMYEFVGAKLYDSEREYIKDLDPGLFILTVDDDNYKLDETYYVVGFYKVIVNTVTVIYDGTNAPDTENVQVTYGDDFVLDLSDIVDFGAGDPLVAYWPSGNETDTDFVDVDEEGKVTIEGVIEALVVKVVASFVGDPQTSDIVFDSEGANLKFTSVTFGETSLTVAFTAAGTVNAEEAFEMGVIVKEDLADTEPSVINATVNAESDEGVIAGTIKFDLEDLVSFDQLFFFGLTDPVPVVEEEN